jgi:hypothetical protein
LSGIAAAFSSNTSRNRSQHAIRAKEEAGINMPQRIIKKIFSSTPWLFVLSVVLSLVKLWLVSGQNFYAMTNSSHDDYLYLERAYYLIHGEWLGPFHELTLIKGIFYPLWIAAANAASRHQLFLSQHILYILSCYLFATAIRPLVKRPATLFIIFAIILFNPMSYADDITARALREGIYPALTILVLGGAIGWMVRCDRPLRNMFLWSMILGMTLSAFWLTREEGVWIIPTILIIISFAAIRIYRKKPADRIWRVITLAVPFLILLASTLTVSAINKTYYGIFSTNELNSPHFLDAYGALTRVKPATWRPLVAVPRETREKLYATSPAFAELRQYLDGAIPSGWIAPGCQATDICDDFASGWFIWAFRDAVARAGYYQSPQSSRFYYQRLASEINTACDEKRLDCGPARSTLTPPWHAEYTRPLFSTFGSAALFLARFQGADASCSVEPARQFILQKSSDFLLMADQKIAFLNSIGRGYQTVLPVLLILSLSVYFVRTISVLRRRIFTDLYIINSLIIITICVRLFVLAFIDISSFPAIRTRYLAPAYPLVLMFLILSLLDGMQAIFEKSSELLKPFVKKTKNIFSIE